MRSAALRGAASLLALSGHLFTQTICPPGFSPGVFAAPGVSPGLVKAAAVFDDGTGPALFVGGGFTSAGSVATTGIAKWNGSVWSALAGGIGGPVVLTVGPSVAALAVFDAGAGPRLYAGGNFSTVGSVPAANITCWDGTAWTALGSGLNGQVDRLLVYDDGGGPLLYVGGGFSLAGSVSVNGWARWNGTAWSATPPGMLANGTGLIAVLDDGTGPVLHGTLWSSTNPPYFTLQVARWDGTSWLPLPGTICCGYGAWGGSAVEQILYFDDGGGPALHIGGNFLLAGGSTVNHVAKWTGTAWAPLGSGLTTQVSYPITSMLVFDDGSGPALYVAGGFYSAGGQPIGGIARWNGLTWSSVGGGLPLLRSLVTYPGPTGPVLHAGGDLGISRWNGSAWEVLSPGGGMNGRVDTLEALDSGSGPRLYAGGGFTSAGGVAASGIAGWDGSSWAPLGTGHGVGTAFAVFDDGGGPALHAAGSFGPANPMVVGVARWSGASWSVLGGGIGPGPGSPPPEVRALAVHDDGSGPALIAGGFFATAGGVPAAGIARWNGVAWTGMNGSFWAVDDLVTFNDGTGPALYAAGPGAVSRWNGLAWVGLPGPPPGAPLSLAVFDDGNGPALYAAGQDVRRWNGAAWTPLPGIASQIRDLAVFDDGRGPALHAAATLAQIGVIARWDGAQWTFLGPAQPPGPGNSMDVAALAVQDFGAGPALYCGGNFLMAGGVPSVHVARWGGYRPALRLTQPGGPGSAFFLGASGLNPGGEYFMLFSAELCSAGAGSGPWLGLCAANPSSLASQILFPIGTEPVHWLASGTSMGFGPYLLPPGTRAEAICIDVTAGVLGCLSPARRLTVR